MWRRAADARHPTVFPLRRLRTRIHLLTLACVAPFVLHAVWVAERPPAADTRQAQHSVQRATAVAQHVDRELQRLDDLLDSASMQLQRSAEVARSDQMAIAPGDPLMSRISIGLLDSTGRRVAQLLGSDAVVDGISADRRRAITAPALRSVHGVPGAPRTTLVNLRAAGTPFDSVALIIGRKVTADDARCDCLRDVNGAVIIALTDAALREMLGSNHDADAAVVTLLDSNANTVAGTEARRWRTAADMAGAGQTASRHSGWTDSAEVGADGVIRSVGFATLKSRPWLVLVGLPTLVAARVDNRLRDTMLLAVLALVLASGALEVTWRAFTRSMLGTIVELMPFAARAPSRPDAKGIGAVLDLADAGESSAVRAPHDVDVAANQSAEMVESFALISALAEFARATADQPELQSVALARLQQLASERSARPDRADAAPADTEMRGSGTGFSGAAVNAHALIELPIVTVKHHRISGDQARFDTMPPTRA